jgi:outer membrane protein assembly factor BamB
MPSARRVTLSLGLLSALSAPPVVGSADWIHWRGPEQNGHAKEPTLPKTFDLSEPGKNNLIWKAPVGGRSSPLLMGDRLFTINAFDPGVLTEGERVSCFDANTGQVLWHYNVNVYHAEVVTSRLGWTTLTADPAAGHVFAHTTAGALLCLDRDGKLVWQRHLSEEFGRFTGYGGRIVSPVFDSGLVITAVVNSSWGDQAKGTNRFIAFDAKTGEVVWIAEAPGPKNFGTYQSHPVVAVIGGQRVLIAGGSDGALNAFKVRTGEKLWTYPFAAGAVNPAPVVDGNLVYGAHGEENPEGGAIGRVVCVDASQVKAGKPKLVWEYRRANRFGLSHPALADGRLYVPDDGAELFCFNAKTGKLLWRYKYGTVSRGAPLINGDRLYIFDVNAKLAVLKLNGDKEPDADETEEHTFRLPPGFTGFVETHASPIAANGRLYFSTSFETYCIGDPAGKPTTPAYKPMPPEAPFNANAEPVAARVFPYEPHLKPGSAVKIMFKFLDANGREVNAPADAKVEWSLPLPPKTPTGAQPPALNATIDPAGPEATLKVPPAPPGQAGYVEAKAGKLSARARVRVVPQIPYAQDFEKVPPGAAPGGWVNAQGKYVVKKLPDGNSVLSKVNTDGRIPIARANGYITVPSATGYTIQADLMATEVDKKLPDMGVVANRYSLVIDGKVDPGVGSRTIRLVSWEARPRVNIVLGYDWKKETWYTAKLTVDVGDKTARVRGKVWEKSQPEPAEWTVTFDDPSPNREGAAALYGYISNISVEQPGSEIYYDNLKISPNGAAKN